MGTDTGVQLQSRWTFRKSEYIHKIVVNRGKETTETLIATDHTEQKLMNISVVSVVISTSVVKIVILSPPTIPKLDRNFGELNLLAPAALSRSNTACGYFAGLAICVRTWYGWLDASGSLHFCGSASRRVAAKKIGREYFIC